MTTLLCPHCGHDTFQENQQRATWQEMTAHIGDGGGREVEYHEFDWADDVRPTSWECLGCGHTWDAEVNETRPEQRYDVDSFLAELKPVDTDEEEEPTDDMLTTELIERLNEMAKRRRAMADALAEYDRDWFTKGPGAVMDAVRAYLEIAPKEDEIDGGTGAA